VALRGQLAADPVKFTPSAPGPGAQLTATPRALGRGPAAGPAARPARGPAHVCELALLPDARLGSGGVRPDPPFLV